MPESAPYVSPATPERRPCPFQKDSRVYFCEKIRKKTGQWAAVVTSVRNAHIGTGYVVTIDVVDKGYTGRKNRQVHFPAAASHSYIFHRD